MFRFLLERLLQQLRRPAAPMDRGDGRDAVPSCALPLRIGAEPCQAASLTDRAPPSSMLSHAGGDEART